MTGAIAGRLRPVPTALLSRLLLPLLLSSLLQLPNAVLGALPCERSGYCSLGKTKPFVGEVDSALGLRAALASRSYKREVILMSTDSERMLPAMQAVGNLHRLGLEHVVMLGGSGPECVRVAGALPSTGCVWLDFELPIFGADREFVVPAIPMWHNRYRLAARIVRLRYNVFLVDTDVIFFDDPYLYFKSPPFANFTIINQPEVLYDQADYGIESEPNGGVLYVQNAAPDGPAAWLLAEVTDRLLRWVEDGFNLTRHTHSLVTWCNYMDQDALRDAISSVRLGRIFFGSTMRDCRTDEWKEAHAAEHAAALAAIEALMTANASAIANSSLQLPPQMRAAAGGASSVEARHFLMRLPAYAPWEPQYGPYLYPATRSVLSRQWVKQLREDCDCPLWPDPEDPSAAPAAAATPAEQYLLAPPFLALNWFARGRLGFWSRALAPAGAQQVVGHLHYIPGTGSGVGKTVAKMAVGHYDWGLARQVLGPRMYFLHQGASTAQPGPDSQPGGPPPLHLLALHPALVAALGAAGSWREMSEVMAGLAAAAFALRRIPVWPDAPCSAPWIAEWGPQGASSLPLNIRQEFIPYGRRRGEMYCAWLPVLNEPCLYGGRGMLSLEFAHWKHSMRLTGALEAAEHNTIGRTAAELGPSVPPSNSTPTARIFNVAMDEVARTWSLRRTHMHKVLYLLNPLNVTYPAGTEESYALSAALSECKATNLQEVEKDLQDKPYGNGTTTTLNFIPASVGPDGVIRAAPAIPGYNIPLASLEADVETTGAGTTSAAAVIGPTDSSAASGGSGVSSTDAAAASAAGGASAATQAAAASTASAATSTAVAAPSGATGSSNSSSTPAAASGATAADLGGAATAAPAVAAAAAGTATATVAQSSAANSAAMAAANAAAAAAAAAAQAAAALLTSSTSHEASAATTANPTATASTAASTAAQAAGSTADATATVASASPATAGSTTGVRTGTGVSAGPAVAAAAGAAPAQSTATTGASAATTATVPAVASTLSSAGADAAATAQLAAATGSTTAAAGSVTAAPTVAAAAATTTTIAAGTGSTAAAATTASTTIAATTPATTTTTTITGSNLMEAGVSTATAAGTSGNAASATGALNGAAATGVAPDSTTGTTAASTTNPTTSTSSSVTGSTTVADSNPTGSGASGASTSTAWTAAAGATGSTVGAVAGAAGAGTAAAGAVASGAAGTTSGADAGATGAFGAGSAAGGIAVAGTVAGTVASVGAGTSTAEVVTGAGGAGVGTTSGVAGGSGAWEKGTSGAGSTGAGTAAGAGTGGGVGAVGLGAGATAASAAADTSTAGTGGAGSVSGAGAV